MGRMKVKVSVILSEDLLKVVDELAMPYKSRSQFVEVALRDFMARLIQGEQVPRDLGILNWYPGRLNQEAADVLSYQIEL